MTYTRIMRRFLRLGHSELVAYLQTVLNRVAERADLSDKAKKEAALLRELTTAMYQVHCSWVARKGELTMVARKKVVRQVQRLLNDLELDINSRDLPAEEQQLLVSSLSLKPRMYRRGRLTTRQLQAQAGSATGSVRLRTRGQALMHEWWYSADIIHYSNPVLLPPTVVANTMVTGLGRGSYAFFCRTYRKNEPPVVEGPVIFVLLGIGI